MPPSLRFLASLVGFATLCAVVSLAVIEYQEKQQAREFAEQMTGGDVEAGKQAMRRFGCGACHQIPNVDGAEGKVGPSLKGIATTAQIAGRLSNQPENMVRWLRYPQAVNPQSGMPDLAISEVEARDMAAHLYTLRH